jgi:hypothetical protein
MQIFLPVWPPDYVIRCSIGEWDREYHPLEWGRGRLPLLVATAAENRLLTPTSYGIFHKRRRKMRALITLKARTGIAALIFVAAAPLLHLARSAFADDLLIIPTFDSSITGNANAAAIEGAINTAIATTEGLYSNSVTLNVTFAYNPDVPGNLGRSFETFFGVSHNQYITALRADLAANPQNKCSPPLLPTWVAETMRMDKQTWP